MSMFIESKVRPDRTLLRIELSAARWMMVGWCALLILPNLGLLVTGVPARGLIFDPAEVAAGQWWRLLSWPWVHVSRYHLLIDGAAFLLLYSGLNETRPGRRLLLVLATAAGSLALPLVGSAQLEQFGLCGLSGVAHGLAAVSLLEMLPDRRQRGSGAVLFGGLLAKVLWELQSGRAFLAWLHLGEIGQPIVACHAGGVIGGLLGYLVLARGRVAAGTVSGSGGQAIG